MVRVRACLCYAKVMPPPQKPLTTSCNLVGPRAVGFELSFALPGAQLTPSGPSRDRHTLRNHDTEPSAPGPAPVIRPSPT